MTDGDLRVLKDLSDQISGDQHVVLIRAIRELQQRRESSWDDRRPVYDSWGQFTETWR